MKRALFQIMKNKRKYILFALLLITVCFIWGNSLISQENSAAQSSGVLEFLRETFASLGVEPENLSLFQFLGKYIRKVGHFSEYFLLGTEVLLFFFFKDFRPSVQRFWNSFSLALFVAVADESIQIFSGRGPMVSDILIDISGAVCGMAVVFGIGKIILRISKKKKASVPEFIRE